MLLVGSCFRHGNYVLALWTDSALQYYFRVEKFELCKSLPTFDAVEGGRAVCYAV